MNNIPLNIDWQQILLHLFNFVILAGGLYVLLYKPVKDFMEKRTQYYRDMDEEAERKLNAAKRMEEEYGQKMAQAEARISEERIEAAQRAEDAAELRLRDAGVQADKILADARKNAQEERQRMMNAAEKEIAALAALAAQRLVQESMDSTCEQFFEAAGKE